MFISVCGFESNEETRRERKEEEKKNLANATIQELAFRNEQPLMCVRRMIVIVIRVTRRQRTRITAAT